MLKCAEFMQNTKKLFTRLDTPIKMECEETHKRGETVKLRELREARGITQTALADAVNVSNTTISMIEIGVNNPSVKLAKKLAKYFGVEWTIFFD